MNTKPIKVRKKQPHRKYALGSETAAKLNAMNAVQLFKEEVRYIYQGLPTRPARYLLMGLRRNIPAELMRGFQGMRGTDKLPFVMAGVGIMSAVPLKVGRRGHSFYTNEKGLEILRYWADKNRDFHGYLQAYCPHDIDKRIMLMRADVAMGLI